MKIEDNIFQRYTPNFKKITDYGFKKNKTSYYFEKVFNNGEFKAVINITKNGKITGKVIDLENNDEFLPLRAEAQQGAFVGKIRKEYKQILTDIRDNCFLHNDFIYNQTNRINNAIITKYGDKPEFMWEKFPNCGVYKNPDNNKWYGIVMDIPRSKLGQNSNAVIEIINVKLDKDKIITLLDKDGYYPAWHMNKKYWITITLDETLPDDEILTHIEESYSYTEKKK